MFKLVQEGTEQVNEVYVKPNDDWTKLDDATVIMQDAPVLDIDKTDIAGNLLPLRAVSALSVALYGMFLAIIIPPARKSRVVAALVAISFALSFVCNYLPGISALSEGTRTILLTVLISSAAAALFPVNPDEQEAEHDA